MAEETATTPMMKCGHAANAKDSAGRPSCVICWGIHPGAGEVDTNPPSLAAREARCHCGKKVNSATSLAFFEHKPELPFDRFYCGCMGWS